MSILLNFFLRWMRVSVNWCPNSEMKKQNTYRLVAECLHGVNLFQSYKSKEQERTFCPGLSTTCLDPSVQRCFDSIPCPAPSSAPDASPATPAGTGKHTIP